MIFNVAQLLKSPVGTSYDVELDDEDALNLEDSDAVLAEPISGHLRLHRTNQGVFASGTVTAPLHMTCSRCLKEFNTDITFPLREEFYPTIDVVTGAPVAAPDDPELAFPINRRHEVDTREAIRQNLVLALPISTLCREDCAGLCEHCGKDLNDGPCDCKPEVVDDRFAVLRELLNGASASDSE
jgi:uncharacterized protein